MTTGGTLTVDGQTFTYATSPANTLDGKSTTNFDLTVDGNGILTITEKSGGTQSLTTVTYGKDNNGSSPTNVTAGVTGSAAGNTVNNAAVTTIDFSTMTGSKMIGATMEIDGTTYQFVANAGDADAANTEVVINAGDTGAQVANTLAGVIGNQTASGAYNVAVTGSSMTLTEATPTGTTKALEVKAENAGGLTLQIGDTSESFNQMSVAIKDMHAKAMKIDTISVKDQASAASAISVIKDAINYVSSTRGDLGAIQNRLEHTSNNLSVMTENIQDAESTIRDTDIAEEMMSYTKNNILVQSAQAMLAQANSVPQGVLQLLQ
jgi:flagellin